MPVSIYFTNEHFAMKMDGKSLFLARSVSELLDFWIINTAKIIKLKGLSTFSLIKQN